MPGGVNAGAIVNPGGGGTGGGFSLSITGNTSGATSLISTGTLSLAGGANITLSQAGQAISIIGGAGAAAGTNTISASGTSIAGSALSLAIAAGANVSLQTATAVGSMTISVSGLNAISANGFASSVGTMVISAGPGIALSTGASTITISNAGMSAASMLGNTSGTASLISTGTLYLQAVSPIVLSQSTTTGTASTGSNILSIAGPTYSAGGGLGLSTTGGVISYSQTAVAASNFTLNGTSNTSVSISAGAGIGIGQANSTITISASVQTSSVSMTALGNTTSSSAGTFSNLLNISGAGIISVGVGAGSITISATTPTVTNFSTISMSAVGNTVNSASGTFNNVLSVSGAGIISVGMSLNNLTISATTAASANVVSGFGITTGAGVTQGTTSTATGTILLAAGNNVTLSSSAGVITINAPAPSAAAISVSATSVAGGSITGGANVQYTTLQLQAGSNIGISQNSDTLVFSAAAAGMTLSATENIRLPQIAGSVASAAGTVTGTAGFGSSLFLQRINIPGRLNLSEVDLAMFIGFPATNQGAGTMTQRFVLYSFGNSTSLASVLSTSSTYAWQTGTSTTAGAASLTQFQGGWSVTKIHPMTFASTSVPAGDYVVGNQLDFAQGSSTWTLSLFGAPVFITNSATISAVTNTAQTTFAGFSNAGTAQVVVLSNAGTAAQTIVKATVTTTASTTGSAAALTVFTAAPTVASRTVWSAAPTTGTVISSLSLSTQTVVPQYLTAPNFVYIGTGSTTSALPNVFLAGIMSTGGIPIAITVTSSAVTYSGTPAGAQPYFALIGA